jgi:hypothetical protein
LTDRYIADLDKENNLSIETFKDLASSVPKDKRESFDSLATALLGLFKRGLYNTILE